MLDPVWLRNVGYIWVVLGIGFTAYNILSLGLNRMNFWVWIGLGCLAFYKFTQAEYAYFDTEEGRVLILKDGNFHTIMNEIKDRRKKAYMDWFNGLEFENGHQLERALDYLIEEKIITKAEAKDKQNLLSIAEEKKKIGFQTKDSGDQLH